MTPVDAAHYNYRDGRTNAVVDPVAAEAEEPEQVLLGEHLDIEVRLVVSPTTGRFQPTPPSIHATAETAYVTPGTVVGTVGPEPIESAFEGWLMGFLAIPGEKVWPGSPIAWIRMSGDAIANNVRSQNGAREGTE
jgi:hypothetical protein